MLDWFNSLQPAQATIVASVFAAFVTITIAVMTIGIKDYFFPVLTERRAARKKRNETFKLYANPLIVSSISLLYRLKEILSARGYFLLNPTPKNEFLEYKYRSTLYRFCCFLGWIRASSLELSFIETNNTKQYKSIQEAMSQFQKKLADGEQEELEILEDLSHLWNIDISRLLDQDKISLGVRIEKSTDEICEGALVESVEKLSSDKQLKLAYALNELINTKVNSAPASTTTLQTSIPDFVKELSRTQGLIYRDWQAAIGDLMIKKTEKELRKYEVISYKEFEAMNINADPEQLKWLTRVNKLFSKLDVTIEERFDGRSRQLRAVYAAVYNVLYTFSKIKVSNVDIATSALKDLPPKI